MAGAPPYPRDGSDLLRDLRRDVADAQTSAKTRAPYTQASQGLWLPNQVSDPAAPANGVILYAKSGHLFCREADGSIHQLTT